MTWPYKASSFKFHQNAIWNLALIFWSTKISLRNVTTMFSSCFFLHDHVNQLDSNIEFVHCVVQKYLKTWKCINFTFVVWKMHGNYHKPTKEWIFIQHILLYNMLLLHNVLWNLHEIFNKSSELVIMKCNMKSLCKRHRINAIFIFSTTSFPELSTLLPSVNLCFCLSIY